MGRRMSVSLNVDGFVEPDETFRKKVAAYRALVDAGEEVPESLREYFGWEEPSDHGRIVEIPTTNIGDMGEGYEIRVADLPAHLTVIRVYLSA
jgi:hypothetical protein